MVSRRMLNGFNWGVFAWGVMLALAGVSLATAGSLPSTSSVEVSTSTDVASASAPAPHRCAASRARDVFLSGYLPVEGEKPVTSAPFLDVDGQKKSVENWKGRSLILNVWATWCPPCVKELPALGRLRMQLQAKGAPIDVIAVNVDKTSIVEVQQFLHKVGAESLEAMVDPDRSFMKAARVGSLPVTLLVNDRGHELAAVLRDADWDDPDIAKFLEGCLDPKKK